MLKFKRYNKSRSYRKKSFRKKKPSLASIIKKVIHKDDDAHHAVIAQNNQVLGANTMYTSSLFTEIAQGTSNATRVGDAIWLEALKVRLNFYGSATSNTVLIRFLIVKSGIEIAGGVSGLWQTGGTGLSTGNVFLNTAVTTPAIDGIIDPKKVTVLYDKVVELTPRISGQVVVHNHNMTIPLKTKHVYQVGNSGYAKMKQIYCIAVPYQLGATTGAAIGTIDMSSDIIFKNAD